MCLSVFLVSYTRRREFRADVGTGIGGHEDGPCVSVVDDIRDVQQKQCAWNSDLKQLAHRRCHGSGTRYRWAPTRESRVELEIRA